MGATLATVAALCKEIYEPRIAKQLNDESVTIKRITRTSDGVSSEVGGKYVTFPIKTRRNAGIGARNENEALPTAGQQGYNAARIGLKYLYGRIQLTGQTIELVDSNPAAFTSALDAEVNGLKTDLLKDQNRQVFADGSGVVATVTAIAAANVTQTVKSVLWFQVGMQVDLIDGTTLGNPTPTVKTSNVQVISVNTTANTVTLGTAVSGAVGDIFVRTGNVNREWTGLTKIIAASGTLYNIDPTTETVWKSEVDGNSGTNRALSEGLMVFMADRVRVNGGSTTLMVSNLGVRRAYFNLLSQQRQYVNTQEFKGGFKGLAFTTDAGEIPYITDIDCPLNTLWFLNEDELKVYREGDWSFMNRDGSMWNRVANFDAYEATMFQYSELGVGRRNTFGVIQDITEG
jgi:hypothetical protein